MTKASRVSGMRARKSEMEIEMEKGSERVRKGKKVCVWVREREKARERKSEKETEMEKGSERECEKEGERVRKGKNVCVWVRE